MRVFVLIASALLAGSVAADGKSAAPAKTPQFKPPAGYRVKIKEWDIVYCRKETTLGSRFPKEVCMTEAELRAYMAANEEMKRNKDQTSRICSGNACN